MMTPCTLCGNGCIPMADYDDRAVCPRCDALHDHALPRWAARLPLSFAAGPGRPEDIAALMAAFDGGSRNGGRHRKGAA